jgi:hypothetical protein
MSLNLNNQLKNFAADPVGQLKDNYFKFVIIFLLFLLLAFDKDLAMIYILIMIGDYIWFKSDNFISFKISSNNISVFRAYFEGLIAFGIFLVASQFLVSSLQSQTITGNFVAGSQAIFELLATTTPILQGSVFLTFIGWAVLVPIIETSFFNGRLLEGLASYAEVIFGQKISLKKISFPLIMVILVVATTFTLFHITAKGLNTIPLLITFVFSVISSLLVVRHQELRSAIFLHILTNGAAVAAQFGYL